MKPRIVPLLLSALLLLATSCRHKAHVPIANAAVPMAPSSPPSTDAAATTNTPSSPQANAALPAERESPAATATATTTADARQLEDAITSLNRLLDTFFDYNAYSLRPEARKAAAFNADLLKLLMARDPAIRLTIEGHCDERGSAEYNLALGDRRAQAVKQMLAELGIDAGRMQTMSWGDTRPQCGDPTEECWQRNRRAHIVPYR